MTVLAHSEASGWAAWVSDPSLVAVAAGAVAYGIGWRAIRARRPGSAAIRHPRPLWYLVGIVTLGAALSPPLDHLADDLFSAHMVQHLAIGLLAPVAFVAARPWPVLSRALPGGTGPRLRHRLSPMARRLRRGSVGLALLLVSAHVAAFAAWHVPSAYDLAVEHPVVHALEHATLFATGLGLWWVVMNVRWRERSGLAVLYLFVVGLPMGALGALLTLAPTPLYSVHSLTTAAWGLTPLEDQQLAGGIMWVPGGVIYLAAASTLFVRWLAAGPAPGEGAVRWGA